MSDRKLRLLLGALLVLAGLLFLVQQLFGLPIGALFIGVLFALGGAAFFYVLIADHAKWWAAIPGFTLLGLGAIIAISKVAPVFNDRFGGAVFLGSIALGFLTILFLKPSFWWPVIPAGVLATLALISTNPGGNGLLSGGFFFLGLGLTFIVVNLVPAGKGEKWSWIPGGICTLMGLILTASSGALVNLPMGWVFSLLIVAAGAFLVIRSLIKKD